MQGCKVGLGLQVLFLVEQRVEGELDCTDYLQIRGDLNTSTDLFEWIELGDWFAAASTFVWVFLPGFPEGPGES